MERVPEGKPINTKYGNGVIIGGDGMYYTVKLFQPFNDSQGSRKIVKVRIDDSCNNDCNNKM